MALVVAGGLLAPPPAHAATLDVFAVVRAGIDFGDVSVGSTSASETVTVTNVSPDPVVVEMAGGAPGAPFGASQNCQSQTLAAGESCEIFYDVRPTVAGEVTGSSSFTLNGEPHVVALRANGVARFRVVTTKVDFGDVGVGSTSDPFSVSVVNVGPDSVVVEMAGGAPGAPFGASQNCQSQTLAAGESCEIFYDVSPTAAGPVTGTSSFSLNGEAHTIDLAANGFVTDATPPVVTPTVTGTPGLAGWYVTDALVTWSVADPESAILSTTGCDPTTVTDTTGQVVTCSATSTGGTTTESVTVKVDTVAPVVTLVGGPADGGTYDYGSVPAAPTCTAVDATSGVAGACVVTGWSAEPGVHTVTGTATDAAGNTGSATATYSVTFDGLLGFGPPIVMDAVNRVKGGSTVPVKFELWNGAIEVTDPAAVTSLSVTRVDCTAWTPMGAPSALPGRLKYDTTFGQFVIGWKVPKPAGRCYLLTATATIGDPLVARFLVV